jgi:hypothetical protein
MRSNYSTTPRDTTLSVIGPLVRGRPPSGLSSSQGSGLVSKILVDAGKSNDNKGETARESSRLAAKQSMRR